MNILFLGGSKRVSMGRKFIDAGKRLGCEVRLFSYELTHAEPISEIATVIAGLRWNDPALFDDLDSVIAEHQIDVVVPFVDKAVEVAAGLAAGGSVFAPVSDPEQAVKMFDKVLAAAEFERCGLPVPKTMTPGDISYPCIAKPRCGSASKGIVYASCEADLDALDLGDYLVQEYVDGAEEYTVDCYVSMINGLPLAISPRKRLETAGGEVTSTVTVNSPALKALSRRLIEQTGLRGAVTIQFLRRPADEALLVMEVNPRLGGGAVASVCAGVDLPAMIISEAMGSIPPEAVPQPDVLVKRYLNEVAYYA